MAKINTDFTKLLDVKTPVVSAPMAGACGHELAAQVTLAGGFGFMPGVAGFTTTDKFRAELETARKLLANTTASNGTIRIGVGFLGWKLDEPDGKNIDLLTLALEARVAAVWFSFGNDLEKWVSLVRDFDHKRTEPHKTLVFVLVNSVDEARVAVGHLNADVLVAQGNEAGGHGHGAAPPLQALVSEILRARDLSGHYPPVLAAGGISTGAHVAALLALGASGVVIGTRFLLTPESTYSPAQKAALIAAESSMSTVRTLAFDVVRGTTSWPAGVDGRGLATKVSSAFDSGADEEVVKHQFREAAKEGTSDGMIVWSGTGVGVVDKIQSAGDVVRELHEETVNALRAAYAMVQV